MTGEEYRTLTIYVEDRTYLIDGDRTLLIFRQDRTFEVDDESRVLEVWTP